MTRRKLPTGTPANDAVHPDGGRDPHPDAVGFELYNRNQPLEFAVKKLGADARALGLSEEDVRRTVGKLLDSAGLRAKEKAESFLYLRISVAGPAFSIEVQLVKELFDPASMVLGLGVSWHSSVTGVHDGDAAVVLSVLSQRMVNFLDEYQDVNADVPH